MIYQMRDNLYCVPVRFDGLKSSTAYTHSSVVSAPYSRHILNYYNIRYPIQKQNIKIFYEFLVKKQIVHWKGKACKSEKLYID